MPNYLAIRHNSGITSYMTLDGNKVRLFLDREDKSKEWLATQLNCSFKTVENILAGRVPRGATLIGLARLMGIQVESLIPKAKAG